MSADCTFDAADAAAKLKRALVGPDGQMARITRLELEILPSGQVRWSLFEGSRRLHTMVGRSGDVAGFCAATQMVAESQLDGGPDDATTCP